MAAIYSMLTTTVTVDGVLITGFWDGDDVISVEPSKDVGEMHVGADGHSVFSSTADRSAKITLKLQPTSYGHSILSARLKAQRAGVLSSIVVTVTAVNGEGGIGINGAISKAPTIQLGEKVSSRDWEIVVGEWTELLPVNL